MIRAGVSLLVAAVADGLNWAQSLLLLLLYYNSKDDGGIVVFVVAANSDFVRSPPLSLCVCRRRRAVAVERIAGGW